MRLVTTPRPTYKRCIVCLEDVYNTRLIVSINDRLTADTKHKESQAAAITMARTAESHSETLPTATGLPVFGTPAKQHIRKQTILGPAFVRIAH